MFVVRVFRFTWFFGIRLVNAGFVVVAGCFYSPGSACFMHLFLCFKDSQIRYFLCYLHPVYLHPVLLVASSLFASSLASYCFLFYCCFSST